MLKKDLAVALGISGAMVSKLAKRGMPTDTLERATRWRKRHLEPGRVKGVRMGTNPPPPPPPPAAPPPAPATPPQNHPAAGGGEFTLNEDSSSRDILWLAMGKPHSVTVNALEIMASACNRLLKTASTPGEADYLLAFLRQLARNFDYRNTPRIPHFELRVWLALVNHAICEKAVIRKESNLEKLLDIAQFTTLWSPNFPNLIGDTWELVCDWDGISITGWPPEEPDDWPAEDLDD
jgi:hypothetical protein